MSTRGHRLGEGCTRQPDSGPRRGRHCGPSRRRPGSPVNPGCARLLLPGAEGSSSRRPRPRRADGWLGTAFPPLLAHHGSRRDEASASAETLGRPAAHPAGPAPPFGAVFPAFSSPRITLCNPPPHQGTNFLVLLPFFLVTVRPPSEASGIINRVRETPQGIPRDGTPRNT